MEILNASEARANLFSLVEKVNKDHLPRIITSRQGDAVLLSKDDEFSPARISKPVMI